MNVDLSTVVIEQQRDKYPEQIWKVMNAMNMDFPDGAFPAIIDKSLIDTLLCASQRYLGSFCAVIATFLCDIVTNIGNL